MPARIVLVRHGPSVHAETSGTFDRDGVQAAGGGTALVVTHGVFRRIMAKQLLASGWKSDSRVGGYRHWSAWSFSPPANQGMTD